MERVQNLLEYSTGPYKRYQFLCIFSSIILKIFLLDPDPGGKMNADPDPQPWLAGCLPIYGIVSASGSDYSVFVLRGARGHVIFLGQFKSSFSCYIFSLGSCDAIHSQPRVQHGSRIAASQPSGGETFYFFNLCCRLVKTPIFTKPALFS